MPNIHQLHQLNPDWDQAVQHGEASKPGIVNFQSMQQSSIQICSCCRQHVVKQPVSIWVHSKQLQFLGLGFPLFYQFLKLCIFMLVVSIGCYNAFAIKWALMHNETFCSTDSQESSSESTDPQCYTFMINLARIQKSFSEQQQTLRIVSFIFQMFTVLYIRNRLIKLDAYYDERSTTLSDYSMIITGINMEEGVNKSILQFLKKQMGPQAPNVQEIMLVPSIDQIQALQAERDEIIQELRPLYTDQETQEEIDKRDFLEHDLRGLNTRIKVCASATYQLMKQDKIACERAIVIFNSEQDKINVLEAVEEVSQETLQIYFGDAKNIEFDEAEEPEQIIWENINLSFKTRAGRVFVGWLLSLTLLGFVFFAFYEILAQKSVLLSEVSEQLKQNPDDVHLISQERGSVFLVLILMFFVVIFGKTVLSTLFHKFTQFERHSSTASLQFSFALKYATGLFFTTALMTLATEGLKFHNYYTHQYGVIDEESIMFFMNAIFIPFFWLINPFRIYKNIKRKILKGNKNLTQQQANHLMQEQSYDLGKRFAEVIEMMWFVYLYSTLLPLGAIVVVFGLFFYYWVDKYNLLRRSKVNGKVSGSFIQTSLTMLDFTLVLRPLGSLIFDYQIRQSIYLTSNLIMMCSGLIYMIFPKNYLIELVNQQNFKPEEKEYKDIKHKFISNYKTCHPIFSVVDDEILNDEKERDNNKFDNIFDYSSNKSIQKANKGNLREIQSQKITIQKDSTPAFLHQKSSTNF